MELVPEDKLRLLREMQAHSKTAVIGYLKDCFIHTLIRPSAVNKLSLKVVIGVTHAYCAVFVLDIC